MFDVLNGTPRPEFAKRSQGFNFEHGPIRVALRIATEIRILGFRIESKALDEKFLTTSVRGPARCVHYSNFLRGLCARVTFHLDIFRSPNEAAVRHVRVAPEREAPNWKELVHGHLLRKNGPARPIHDGQRPRSGFNRPQVSVGEPMQNRHMIQLSIERNFDFLLQAGAGFHGLDEFECRAIPLMFDGRIVRRIGARHNLRAVPEAMAAVGNPFVSSRFSHLVGKFLKKIFAVSETQANDSRANIGRRHQINFAIAQFNTIRPAAVINFSHSGLQSLDSKDANLFQVAEEDYQINQKRKHNRPGGETKCAS